MEDRVIVSLNSLKKTGISELMINDSTNRIGTGKLKIGTIVLKDIIYQFIIVNTTEINKLVFRYYDKVWSPMYLEMDYINDSNIIFDLNYFNFIKNKHYDLLIKKGIRSITLTKNNVLKVNNIIVRKR